MFKKKTAVISVFVLKTSVLVYFRNKAIADYLYSNGFQGALEHFQKEAGMVSLTLSYLVVINISGHICPFSTLSALRSSPGKDFHQDLLTAKNCLPF